MADSRSFQIKKKVVGQLISQGTIFYSDQDWLGTAIVYRLFEYHRQYYELSLKPITMTSKVKAELPYSFGLTLQARKVVRVQLATDQSKGRLVTGKKTTSSGVPSYLIQGAGHNWPDQWKLKLKIQRLASLDFWMTGSVKGPEWSLEPDLLRVPNLINFHPPTTGKSFQETYPLFQGLSSPKNWWLTPACDQVVKKNQEEQEKQTRSDVVTENNREGMNLFYHFKLLELKIHGVALNPGQNHLGQMGHWLSLVNKGPAINLIMLVDRQVVANWVVDEQLGMGYFFIPSQQPLEIRLDHPTGPVLIEQRPLGGRLLVKYLQMGEGLWVELKNNWSQSLTCQINLWDQSKPIADWQLTLAAQSHQKKFISNPDQKPWLCQIQLVTSGFFTEMISEYRFTNIVLPPSNIQSTQVADKSPETRKIKVNNNQQPTAQKLTNQNLENYRQKSALKDLTGASDSSNMSLEKTNLFQPFQTQPYIQNLHQDMSITTEAQETATSVLPSQSDRQSLVMPGEASDSNQELEPSSAEQIIGQSSGFLNHKVKIQKKTLNQSIFNDKLESENKLGKDENDLGKDEDELGENEDELGENKDKFENNEENQETSINNPSPKISSTNPDQKTILKQSLLLTIKKDIDIVARKKIKKPVGRPPKVKPPKRKYTRQ